MAQKIGQSNCKKGELELGALTELNRKWLDSRFRRDPETKSYFAHEPIYGMSSKLSEPNHPTRYARLCAILCTLEKLPFKSLLDVGGAEGYLSYLVGRLFNAWAVTSDLSFEANCRAAELFDVPGVALQSADLPFESNSFDVVTSIETLEHVEYPIETLLELYRVAKESVIITTEALSETEKEQSDRLANRRYSPHFERNWFMIDDFRDLFPNLLIMDFSWIKTYLCEKLKLGPDKGTNVIKLLIIPKQKDCRPAAEVTLEQVEGLLNFLLSQRFPEQLYLDISDRQISRDLLRLLRCPNYKSELILIGDRLVCRGCAETYLVKSGIPVLLADDGKCTTKKLRQRLLKLRHESNYIARAVELREKFDFEMSISKALSWRFNDVSSLWRPLANIELVAIREDYAEFEATDDPQLISPILSLDLSTVRSMAIVYAVSGCEHSMGQVFWGTENNGFAFSESDSATFEVMSGDFKRYEVQLKGKMPKSEYGLLRFHPTQCPARVKIRSAELLLEGSKVARISNHLCNTLLSKRRGRLNSIHR